MEYSLSVVINLRCGKLRLKKSATICTIRLRGSERRVQYEIDWYIDKSETSLANK